MVQSIGELFEALGGVTAISTELALPLGTVSAWKTRGSIPANHWEALVTLAARRAVAGVTIETLHQINRRAA